jgi:hypothetical protein
MYYMNVTSWKNGGEWLRVSIGCEHEKCYERD